MAVSRKRSILIYCGDVLGLGHQRRNMAIASRLVEEEPDADVILLTSLAAGFVPGPDRVDVIKLPSLRKVSGGGIGARSLGLSPVELRRLRRGIIEATVREFRCDLVLVDHKPTGVWNELLPSLMRWRADPRGPVTVLGVRDILDDPDRTVSSWNNDGVYEAIDTYYDRVIVYGTPEVFPTLESYGLAGRAGARYCGYVCPEINKRGRDVARRELGLSAGRVAVVSTGGGADGFPVMRDALAALRHMQAPRDLELVCVAGPFMEPEQLAELRRLAADLPARVIWWADQLPIYFEAADLIVTMAGYNTLLEAVRQGRPTLVLPRNGPSAEQRIRARELGRRGVVRVVSDLERGPERLAALMLEQLEHPTVPQPLPKMNGLERTVATLRALLDERDARIGGGRRVRRRRAAGGAP